MPVDQFSVDDGFSLLGDFPLGDFPDGDCLVVFSAGVFRATFFAVAFLGGAFFAVAFLGAAFFAVAFLGAAFFAEPFLPEVCASSAPTSAFLRDARLRSTFTFTGTVGRGARM